MQVMYRDGPPDTSARRPTWLELSAAGLLLATVILQLVAMFPTYFGGSASQGSVWSQPDQAALYGVLTAGWALALGLVLAGPTWIRLGAATAVGLAVTELGFRVADVGQALHDGVGQSSTGMWLMTAGWVTGAVGAALAAVAVRRRARIDAVQTDPIPSPAPVVMTPPVSRGGEPPAPLPLGPSWAPQPDQQWAAQWNREPSPHPGWTPWAPTPELATSAEANPSQLDRAPSNPWAPPPPRPPAVSDDIQPVHDDGDLPVPFEPAADLPVEATPTTAIEPTAPLPIEPSRAGPLEPTTAFPMDTAAVALADATDTIPASETAPFGPYGAGLTVLVALLAVVTAGAFLPAWDRYVGLVTTTGRTVSFNLGNAFSGPWPLVLGNVLVALALAAVPMVASRLRDWKVAAFAVVGSLLVLASQFTAAIVQVNQPVPPAVAGLTPAQAEQLGLQLHMSLTGWFTLDVLAAYGLFVAVMVIGYLRPATVQENSAGTWATAPEARSPASLPSS
jgi:hypothetical protein